jgi:DNA-binding response OmpR family regulator
MIRVLYIDDEPSLLEIGKVFLERDGKIKVDTLISPSEALKRLKYERYDAIISDYEMPEKNGVELLKLLKTAGDTTPFIIFTGRGREEVVIEAFNNGADFYIQKGGDPKAQFIELSNKIHYAISRRRAEEALLASVEGIREASSRYAVLIAASNTGAWEYHNNSGFLWCSSEYFSMLGREINDFDLSRTRNIDQTWIDLLHPNDRARAIQNFDTYLICPEGMY